MEKNPTINPTEAIVADVIPSPAAVPVKATKPRDPVTGVVGRAPNGFAEIRAAIKATGINAETDMSVAAIRATVTKLTEAMGTMPPAKTGRGRTTGLRTYDFQNTLYAINDRPEWRFTDRTLCVVWAVELSANKCDYPAHADYVGSTRTDYRRDRHGSNVIDPKNHDSKSWPLGWNKPATKK
jgi:hypothetical protein